MRALFRYIVSKFARSIGILLGPMQLLKSQDTEEGVVIFLWIFFGLLPFK